MATGRAPHARFCEWRPLAHANRDCLRVRVAGKFGILLTDERFQMAVQKTRRVRRQSARVEAPVHCRENRPRGNATTWGAVLTGVQPPLVSSCARPCLIHTWAWSVLSELRSVGRAGITEDEGFAVGVGALLHDIFGNPFRLVNFAPEWRTDTATALARQMLRVAGLRRDADPRRRAPGRRLRLEDVLTHCRDANQVHVRRCWVIDAVLGLS